MIFVCSYGCVVYLFSPLSSFLSYNQDSTGPVTVTLHIRKNTQKSRFLLSQTLKWKKLCFSYSPRCHLKLLLWFNHFKYRGLKLFFFYFSICSTSWTTRRCSTGSRSPRSCTPGNQTLFLSGSQSGISIRSCSQSEQSIFYSNF